MPPKLRTCECSPCSLQVFPPLFWTTTERICKLLHYVVAQKRKRKSACLKNSATVKFAWVLQKSYQSMCKHFCEVMSLLVKSHPDSFGPVFFSRPHEARFVILVCSADIYFVFQQPAECFQMSVTRSHQKWCHVISISNFHVAASTEVNLVIALNLGTLSDNVYVQRCGLLL